MRVLHQVEPYLLAAVYSAIPLATLAADNADLVRMSDVVPYYVAALAVCCVAVAIVRVRRGPAAARTAGLCVAATVLLVFDYRELRPLLASIANETRPAMLYLWAALTGAAVFAAARLTKRVPSLPTMALVAGVLMVVPPFLRYSDRRSELVPDTAPRVPIAAAPKRLVDDRPREVYFFLLDAYSRPDRIREQFGFDDSAFVDALRARGFVVPPGTRSSYPSTLQSVPSILNMQYQEDTRGAITAMTGSNRVANTFRRLGYAFGLAPNGLDGWGCTGAEDMCIPAVAVHTSRFRTSDLGWAVLERTPGADLLEALDAGAVSSAAAKRQFPSRVAKAVTGQRRARPMFVFAHSLLPHSPYPYQGPDCRVNPGEPRGAGDYVGAVECANADTLAAVGLIARRDPDAVVILASDHGTEIGSARGAVKPGSVDAQRRLSNFVALRLPRRCRDDVPYDLAAVNIFRVVLNCLTTVRWPLLPYRASLLK